MLYKTAELEGELLDATVAIALGMRLTGRFHGHLADAYMAKDCGLYIGEAREDPDFGDVFEPSTRWDHGGPIIHKEKIKLTPVGIGMWFAELRSELGEWPGLYYGPTPLIAAMRAYCYSKCGVQVELP